MTGKRKYDIDMLATKNDIVKDIVADTISQGIQKETGLACSKRENTEIRLNITKLENLVKQYDLNNPTKEIPLYEFKEDIKIVPTLLELKTRQIIKKDLSKNKK